MGIVREKTGDILAGPDSADVLLIDHITDFVARNWESAGRAKLTVREIDLTDIRIPEIKARDYHDTVSSLRLDSILSSGFRIARGKAADPRAPRA